MMTFVKANKNMWFSLQDSHGFWITIKRRSPRKSFRMYPKLYYWCVTQTKNNPLIAYKGYEYELSLTAAKKTALGVILERIMINNSEETGAVV